MFRLPLNHAQRRQCALCYLSIAVAVALLVGCATDPTSGESPGDARVVRALVTPLIPVARADAERQFADGQVRGTLDASGKWRARAEISHPRLRCATYQLEMNFGVGDAACNSVAWETVPVMLPSRRQCNNATLIHSGEGVLDLPPDRIRALNCVRVAVRCTGHCG